MFFFIIAAWLAGCIVSFVYGNMKLPFTILGLGVVALAAHFTIGLSYGILAIMGVMNVVIWFSNKMEMT